MAIHNNDNNNMNKGENDNQLINASAKQPYVSKEKRNINDSTHFNYSEMNSTIKNKHGGHSRTVMGNYNSL